MKTKLLLFILAAWFLAPSYGQQPAIVNASTLNVSTRATLFNNVPLKFGTNYWVRYNSQTNRIELANATNTLLYHNGTTSGIHGGVSLLGSQDGFIKTIDQDAGASKNLLLYTGNGPDGRGKLYLGSTNSTPNWVNQVLANTVEDADSSNQVATTAFVKRNRPSGGTGSPGGSNGQLQYNLNGGFAGTSGLVWDASYPQLMFTGAYTKGIMIRDMSGGTGLVLNSSDREVIGFANSLEIQASGAADDFLKLTKSPNTIRLFEKHRFTADSLVSTGHFLASTLTGTLIGDLKTSDDILIGKDNSTGAFMRMEYATGKTEFRHNGTTIAETSGSGINALTGYPYQYNGTPIISNSITSGVTTSAPNENQVYTALAGKASLTGATFTGSVIVPTEAYGAGWSGDNGAATKADLYTKIESLGSGGGGAPTSATYLTASADATLTSEVNLGALGTGFLYGTVTGGVSSISSLSGITESKLSLSDLTTGNFSTSMHGFVPKGTNTGKFLKDDGTWATPSGTSSTVTVAVESTDATCYPLFVTDATGDLGPKSNTGLTFNSSTSTLTATNLAGSFDGDLKSSDDILIGKNNSTGAFIRMYYASGTTEIRHNGTAILQTSASGLNAQTGYPYLYAGQPIISNSITSGVTTSAPNENQVYTALAGKASLTGATFTGSVNVPAETYGAGWSADNGAPTKADLYTKIESMGSGGGGAPTSATYLTASADATLTNEVNLGALGTGFLYGTVSGGVSSVSSFSAVSENQLSLSDVTTGNFSTTKHGFVPKGTNTGKFLKDDGTWASVSAGAGGTSGSVQYNNGGSLAGFTGVTYSSGHLALSDNTKLTLGSDSYLRQYGSGYNYVELTINGTGYTSNNFEIHDGVTTRMRYTTSGGTWDLFGSTTVTGSLTSTTYLQCAEQSVPSTPSSGYGRIYFNTSGDLCYKNDLGDIRTISYTQELSMPKPEPEDSRGYTSGPGIDDELLTLEYNEDLSKRRTARMIYQSGVLIRVERGRWEPVGKSFSFKHLFTR